MICVSEWLVFQVIALHAWNCSIWYKCPPNSCIGGTAVPWPKICSTNHCFQGVIHAERVAYTYWPNKQAQSSTGTWAAHILPYVASVFSKIHLTLYKCVEQGRIHGQYQSRTGGQGRKCAVSYFLTRVRRTNRRNDRPTDGQSLL